MTPNTVPHLCGGILFDLLLEARKPRQKARNKLNGGSDGLTIPGVFSGLIEVVTGDDVSTFAGKTLAKCATNYRKCDDSTGEYVPFTKVSVQSSFKNLYITNKPLLLERTAGFIEKYLNKDKCVWLVAALIETMQKDKTVDGDTLIAVNYSDSMPVKELNSAKKIVFLPFFLSVLHYVMANCPDCESGKETFLSWYSQATPKSEWKFKSNIGNEIPAIDVDTDLNLPQTGDPVTDTVGPETRELSDHEVISNALIDSARAMATVLGAAEHQIAEEIRQKQKKQAPPEEEPVVEEINTDDQTDNESGDQAKPTVLHQTVVNQYGDHPVHIDHVENLKL